MEKHTKETRKGSTPLKVYCLSEEKELIKRQADAAGLSVTSYLRTLGLGYEIHGILDYQRVDDLAQINADLGRMGGLLKLWLTNDERIMQFRPVKMRAIILQVLAKIERNQDELRTVIKTIVVR